MLVGASVVAAAEVGFLVVVLEDADIVVGRVVVVVVVDGMRLAVVTIFGNRVLNTGGGD